MFKSLTIVCLLFAVLFSVVPSFSQSTSLSDSVSLLQVRIQSQEKVIEMNVLYTTAAGKIDYYAACAYLQQLKYQYYTVMADYDTSSRWEYLRAAYFSKREHERMLSKYCAALPSQVALKIENKRYY